MREAWEIRSCGLYRPHTGDEGEVRRARRRSRQTVSASGMHSVPGPAFTDRSGKGIRRVAQLGRNDHQVSTTGSRCRKLTDDELHDCRCLLSKRSTLWRDILDPPEQSSPTNVSGKTTGNEFDIHGRKISLRRSDAPDEIRSKNLPSFVILRFIKLFSLSVALHRWGA